MKGITPVIAVILLLLITLSMVGFAFVWFSRVAETAGAGAEAQLEQQLSTAAQTIRIDATPAGATGSATNPLTIRNTGSQNIPQTSLKIFFNGAAVGTTTAVTCTPNPLPPGGTTVCTWAPTVNCNGDDIIRVTAPGNSDEVSC